MLTRRQMLSATAAGGAVVTTGTAQALTYQETPAVVESIYLKACAERAFHATLLAEAAAVLDSGEVAETDKAEIRKGITCPLCRCTLVPTP